MDRLTAQRAKGAYKRSRPQRHLSRTNPMVRLLSPSFEIRTRVAIVTLGALVMPQPRPIVRAITTLRVTTAPPAPSIAYALLIDPSRPDIVVVGIRLDLAPRSVRLAMMVHHVYVASYLHFLYSLRAVGS